MASLSHRTKSLILLLIVTVSFSSLWFMDKVPQNLSYHNFSDQRTFLSIPNFWNVITNLAFLLVSFLGLKETKKNIRSNVFFIGVSLVCFGSGYYHWNPSNETLLWDRLPMAIVFMAFLSIVISNFISVDLAKKLFIPLLILGIFSVLYWYISELLGNGDLRVYGIVQFVSLILILCIMVLYAGENKKWIYLTVLVYGVSKVLESFDRIIYETISISGHSIKHIVAAASIFLLLIYIRKTETIRSLKFKRELVEKETIYK